MCSSSSMGLPSLAVNTCLEQFLKLQGSTSVYCGKYIIKDYSCTSGAIMWYLSMWGVSLINSFWLSNRYQRIQPAGRRKWLIPPLLVSCSKWKCKHTESICTSKLRVNLRVYILQLKSVMKLHFWKSRRKNNSLILLIVVFLKEWFPFILLPSCYDNSRKLHNFMTEQFVKMKAKYKGSKTHWDLIPGHYHKGDRICPLKM